MRRRMAIAVLLPLVVVAALVGLRLTTGRSEVPGGDPTTSPSTAPVTWQDSLQFAITPDRMLRISTTRGDICLTPEGTVQPFEKNGLQVGLRRDAEDHCTRPEAGEPVDVALPKSLDVTKVVLVLVVSDLIAYPSYDVDNALYDSGVPA